MNIMDKIKEYNLNEGESNSKKRNRTKTRLKNNKAEEGYLRFTINEDKDDYLCKIIKKAINESNVTLQDVYDAEGTSSGYNLFYGLVTRHKITFETFKKWCAIIGMDFEINLFKK